MMLKFATNHARGPITQVVDSLGQLAARRFDMLHRCQLCMLQPHSRQRLAVVISNPLRIGTPRPGFPHPGPNNIFVKCSVHIWLDCRLPTSPPSGLCRCFTRRQRRATRLVFELTYDAETSTTSKNALGDIPGVHHALDPFIVYRSSNV